MIFLHGSALQAEEKSNKAIQKMESDLTRRFSSKEWGSLRGKLRRNIKKEKRASEERETEKNGGARLRRTKVREYSLR